MQWTVSPPIKYPAPTKWKTIDYTYDPAGRRIKKTIDDDYRLKYVYDGGNVIAEYDHDNYLLRKYIYGPGVDEPVCMIDVADNDAEYYYHRDGLGSVVALSDSNGDTVQTYEYSIYGQVAASDPNFLTNPYMFTGRRFDIETGLYYYRVRYYNPHVGCFMQTDPIGYGDGINWYSYCGNNPLAFVDPWGLSQKVTGKYWVLPNFNDPDTGMFWNGVRWVVRGIINQVDEIISGAPDLGEATEKLEEMATAVGTEVKGMWRSFIEVYDCSDEDGDGIIDANEITSDTYWIEVTGIGSGGTKAPTEYDPTGGWKGDHYDTSGSAMDAAGTAIKWASAVWSGKQPSIAGVIPEDTTCLNEWLFEDGDLYGYIYYGDEEEE